MRVKIAFVTYCLVAGCGAPSMESAEEVATEDQPIIGGSDDLGDPSVVAVVSSDESLCTGAVVGRRSVLTAAHCVKGKTGFEVIAGVSTRSVTARHFAVDGIPTFDNQFDQSNLMAGHDIACIRLAQDVGVPALPYHRGRGLGTGPARIVGFGTSTHNGFFSGIKRTAMTRHVHPVNDRLVAIGTPSVEQCHGDSGGPAFQTIDGQERIVGIASFVFDRKPRLCVDQAFDTRVDAYQEFIDSCACSPTRNVKDLPLYRFAHAAVRGPDGRLYVVGGVGPNGLTQEVDAYDACTNTWTTVEPIPTPRYAPAAAVGADGRIYVMGSEPIVPGGDPLDTVEAYDLVQNKWFSVTPMLVGRGDPGAALGPDGRIYVVGGLVAGGQVTAAVEAYDTRTDTWTQVAPLSQARMSAAVVAGANGAMYAISGNDDVCNAFATVETYDAARNQWGFVKPLPQALSNRTVAGAGPDGRIYAASGSLGPDDCSGGSASNLFIYDPPTDSWNTGPDMPTGVRAAAGAFGAGPNALFYVFGGIALDGSAVTTAQAYDPAKSLW